DREFSAIGNFELLILAVSQRQDDGKWRVDLPDGARHGLDGCDHSWRRCRDRGALDCHPRYELVNPELLAVNGDPRVFGNIREIPDSPIVSLDDDIVSGNVNYLAAPYFHLLCRRAILYLCLSLHLRVRAESEGRADKASAQQIAEDRSCEACVNHLSFSLLFDFIARGNRILACTLSRSV